MNLSNKAFPVPGNLKQHGPARIIAMCNQKGGVGKTTTTINLAAALAEYGRKILVVDFDPQGALSVNLDADYQDATTIYDLLMDSTLDPVAAIQKTSIENLDVIPANIDLSAAEMNLVTEMGRERVLDGILKKVKNDYDIIFIDCQPSLGLLTVNALTAAHGVLIPDGYRILCASRGSPIGSDDRQGQSKNQSVAGARRAHSYDARFQNPARP